MKTSSICPTWTIRTAAAATAAAACSKVMVGAFAISLANSDYLPETDVQACCLTRTASASEREKSLKTSQSACSPYYVTSCTQAAAAAGKTRQHSIKARFECCVWCCQYMLSPCHTFFHTSIPNRLLRPSPITCRSKLWLEQRPAQPPFCTTSSEHHTFDCAGQVPDCAG